MKTFVIVILVLVIIQACYFAKIQRPAACQRCAADVTFLVDESSSVTPISFRQNVIPFLVNMTYGLQIGPSATHLSVVHYSDPEVTGVDAYLNTFYAPTQLADLIKRLVFNAGNTALYTALQLVYSDVYTSAKGARVQEYGKTVAAYTILVTDGIATDSARGDPSEITKKLIKAGVSVYAVGIGKLITREYLEKVTQVPDRVYMTNNFSDLTQELVDKILTDLCCPIHHE